MTIVLRPELERYVEDQVRIGRFGSQAEVVEAGLARLMSELDVSPDEDWAAINEAEQEIAEGKGLKWPEVSAELRQEFMGK